MHNASISNVAIYILLHDLLGIAGNLRRDLLFTVEQYLSPSYTNSLKS
jgi:hypothetical protein